MFVISAIVAIAHAMELSVPAELPPITLHDLDWLPEAAMTFRAHEAAVKHFEFCKEQRAMRLSPQLPWRAWEEEAGHAVICWELLLEARQEYSWMGCGGRLQCLAELRRRLGLTAYYAGAMPDPHHVYGPHND